MIVQWAIKGISGGSSGISDVDAKALIDDGHGIICNWWRNAFRIAPPQIRAKLSYSNLLRHVNQYAAPDPVTGQPFSESTPFISLTAGCVERNTLLRTNLVIPARQTALEFATEWGTCSGYLFYCWVLVSINPAVEIEAAAEEIRELNTYRSYSSYQTEGEIAAKIQIPSNQIEKCEKYDPTNAGLLTPTWVHRNPNFESPEPISNVREFF